MSYVPRHGTVAYRALAHLETIRTQERTASQIAEALGGGINGSEIAASLAPAVSAGVVFRRQRDKTTPRAPQFYSLTDMERHTREFRPNPAGWLERPAVFKAQGGTEPGHPLADARSKAARAVMEAIAIAPNSQRHESGAQHGGDAGNLAHNTEHAAPLGGLAEGEGATAPSPGMREAKADEGALGTPPSRGRIELAVPQFRRITTITRKDAEESGSKPGTPGAPDGVVTSSAPRAADDAPSGEGPAAADAPRARAAEPIAVPGSTPLPNADRLLPGDYLVHKRSGIEVVYGEGQLQPSTITVPSDGAKFALWCDGELTLFVGDTELTLKPAQVQRLRKLLGSGA
ncbi:MAG: hypothetical protein RJA36_1655 [Pseudomonadota bacterium]